MAITYVGVTHIDPPNTAATTVSYPVVVPTGVMGPSVVLATFVAGGASAPSITTPSGWTHIAGTPRCTVYAYAWSTGDPTSFAFSSTGAGGAGYWAVRVDAWNGAVIDTRSSVTNSEDSPPLTTSSPYDWLVSIYAVCQVSTSTYPTCSSSGTAVSNRGAYLWTTTPTADAGVYGIGVADSGSYIAQGLLSSGTFTWSPVLSQLSGWGTMSVAISGAVTPSLPTNYSPGNGSYLDFTVEQFFSANYNNIDGSVCQAWQFRQKIAGAASYNYWNAGSAAFQTTAVWNAGTASFTLPSGVLSNSNTYNWSFNTESSYEATLTSGFAPDFTVIGQPPPTVAVSAPTGTVATAAPMVTWSATAGGTATLTGWRVVTYLTSTTTAAGFSAGQSAGLLDDSGPRSGTATSYQTGFLPNSSGVTSLVQVTQSGNQSSPWAASVYTTSFTVPSAPSLSTAGPTLDSNGAPVVALTVVCPSNSGITGTLTATVFFTDTNNPTPTAVRQTAPVATAGDTVVIADYELTFGVTRTYRAAVVSSSNGQSAYSGSVSVTQYAPGVGGSRNWVLSDPTNPSLFLVLSRLGGQSSGTTALQAQTSIEVDRARNQTIFRPFGKSTAVTQYGDVYQPTFTLNFLLQGYAQAAMYDALWSTTDTLLVRSDMGDAWYVDAGPTRPLVILSAGDRNINPLYQASLACTVTDKP